MFNEAELIRWPDFPACYNENFNSNVLQKIKEKPGVWLSTLPMYEYAWLALVAAMRKFGGELRPYLEDLFNQRMMPIITKYLSALTRYRMHRHIHMMNFDKFRRHINKKSITEEARAMRCLAAAARIDIRRAVMDFVEEERFKYKTIKVNDLKVKYNPVRMCRDDQGRLDIVLDKLLQDPESELAAEAGALVRALAAKADKLGEINDETKVGEVVEDLGGEFCEILGITDDESDDTETPAEQSSEPTTTP